MPNYCYNSLSVHGDRAELDKFHKKMTANENSEVRLLETFLPTPTELIPEPMVTDDGRVIGIMSDEQYDWCVKTWGTKWPEGDMTVDDFPDMTMLQFSTAWSPPIAGIKAIAKMFPSFEFIMEWSEEGMGFIGASYHKGDTEVILDEEMPEVDYTDGESGMDEIANRRDVLGSAVLEQGRNA